MKKIIFASLIAIAAMASVYAHAERGNTSIQSFNKAKKFLTHQVVKDRRITLYCQAEFEKDGKLLLPEGFQTPAHEKRLHKIEWEHVVPTENFGKNLIEWRKGSPRCVDSKGRLFKGRKCAEKVNFDFRYMQSDMHNLFPSIGSVNAVRGNKNYALLPGVRSSFGSCLAKLDGNRFEPPVKSRGPIARAYLYMDWAYPLFSMSRQQKQLMQAWDKQYPPEKWECVRASRIAKIQGNENPFVKESCQKAGY